MLYAAKDALHIQDIVIQSCVALSRISSACFLFLDHILWLHRVKVINIDIKPISKLCNQFWLLSSIVNLIRNIYDWHRIQQNRNSQGHTQRRGIGNMPQVLPTALDTAKNAFDVLIPMNSLQYVSISGVVQGTTGAISSIIGLLTIWNEHLKLQNK